jgi:GNAT superfamily N-acetyltransferase
MSFLPSWQKRLILKSNRMVIGMEVHFKIAETAAEFELGKKLFMMYAESLTIDLSFQNFKTELQEISKQYYKPDGALILAYYQEEIIGCAGIRQLEPGIAELKRMYVLSAYRGNNIGLKLLQFSIETARDLHYKTIRLDTLPEMKKAQELYRATGFSEIEAYRYNPVQGTIYMEKNLTT